MIHVIAVLFAAFSAFVLGGFWYSPKLFGNTWCKEANMHSQSSHHKMVFIYAILLSLVAATVFSYFLGPHPHFGTALLTGFLIGLCWVASSFGINYLFAGRSLTLFFIDAGYHTLQFTLYGIIFGIIK